jgi:hypothetical protein
VLCAGADCAGADWTGADCVDAAWVEAEATDVEEAGVLLACAGDEVAADVCLLGFGFLAGARSAGTATAAASGVIAACCAAAELGAANEAGAGAGADVFLIADPMAKAAPSPTTSATISSAQRLRTS